MVLYLLIQSSMRFLIKATIFHVRMIMSDRLDIDFKMSPLVKLINHIILKHLRVILAYIDLFQLITAKNHPFDF